MSEAGIYVLTKALLGGVSALMTGPFGTLDLPPGSLEASLTASGPGLVIELVSETGARMGRVDDAAGGSPGDALLHPAFVPGLIATEDARFYEHPGVDPFAVLSALTDRSEGRIRGGSSLTQQSVKNEILGNSRTLERKALEAIVSVRAVHELGRDRILDGYLSKSWFGRGTFGTVGAAQAWFGKSWDQVTLSETALLIGLLKGPARYDPDRNPEAARSRRDAVLGRMIAEGVVDIEQAAIARTEIIEAPGATRSAPTDPWVRSAVIRELETGSLPASDAAQATLTLSPEWQALAQEAVSWGAYRIDGAGAAGSVPAETLRSGDPDRIRAAMTPLVDTSREVGRALVTGAAPLSVLIDRGYGPLEPETRVSGPETARPGEVYAYRRVGDRIELIPAPRVNAAAVVMEARTGAILAAVGGANPEMSRFDRTMARRQVGSAIKPFLWGRALEAGYRHDDLVPDINTSYVTPTGEVWSPRNYDGSETGLIPLFVALEESSNNVAAMLIDQLGPRALSEIAEAAGVYPPGSMSLHPSSALGASESTLIAMAAGYASIANGGVRVTPHTYLSIMSAENILVPKKPDEIPVMTERTASLLSSMLYGVTVRGTAARAFGQSPPIGGKTGTTQSHRDAWFVGFGPDLVVAVWVGRDDNTPLPPRTTGSSAAAPIAARIIEAADRAGLTSRFVRPGAQSDWPPSLLEAGYQPAVSAHQGGALIFEPDPEARRRAMQAGSDPFKNPQDLFDQIRQPSRPLLPEQTPEGTPQGDIWDQRVNDDPWSQRPPADPFDAFSSN
jgi:penicillin-binding protein 1A